MRATRTSSRFLALSVLLFAGALAGCGEDLNKKGVAQMEAGQFEAAAQTFRDALAKDKTNTDALRNLIRARIELLSDDTLGETRELLKSLREANRESDAAALEKAMTDRANAGALTGKPAFSKHLVTLFDAGEMAALPVILKNALDNPARFEATFAAMTREKKDEIMLAALKGVQKMEGKVAALTHIVWRKAPSKATEAATVQAQRGLMLSSDKAFIEAAGKAIADLPQPSQVQFYKDVFVYAKDRSPSLAAAGAWLEAKAPATYVEWNILRIAGTADSASLNCSKRRVDAVNAILRSLEESKPVAFSAIGGGWQQNIKRSSVGYLAAVKKAHDEKPEQKYEALSAKDCLALYERLHAKAN